MTEREEQILYKKIALRFFKETGFYNSWKEYIKANNKIGTWNRVNDITDIFHNTYFGKFLRDKYRIDLTSKFGSMFKKYLSIVHQELYSSYYGDVNGIEVEEQTGRVIVHSRIIKQRL